MYLGSTAYRPATAYTQQMNTTRQTQLGYYPQDQLPSTTTKQAFGAIINSPQEFLEYMMHDFGNNPKEDAATIGTLVLCGTLDTIGSLPSNVRRTVTAIKDAGSATYNQAQEIVFYFQGPGNHHVKGLQFGVKMIGMPLYAIGYGAEKLIINPASRRIAGAFKQARGETAEETIERLRTTMNPKHFAEIMAYIEDYQQHGYAVSNQAKKAERNINKLSSPIAPGPYGQYLPRRR
jgi:hypothetical protein